MEKKVLGSWQGCIHRRVISDIKLISMLRTALHFVKCSTVAILKFIIIEHGILHFHLALHCINYVASVAYCLC